LLPDREEKERQPAQTIAGASEKASLPSRKSRAIPRMLPPEYHRRLEAAFQEETRGFWAIDASFAKRTLANKTNM